MTAANERSPAMNRFTSSRRIFFLFAALLVLVALAQIVISIMGTYGWLSHP